MIQCEREICSNFESARSREWLETNGLGGYASSTLAGLNTRRYHGLLVAATKPPVGRFVLLSKLEETLVIDGKAYELSANHYPGIVHPQGFQYLKQFRLDPFPIFTFDVQRVEIEKSVFMVHGENTTVVRYELKAGNAQKEMKECRLEVRPLIAFRDHHSTTHENPALDPTVELHPSLASVTPYAGLPALHVAHNAPEPRATGHWYRSFEYDAERERGLDFTEDLFNPYLLRFDLRLSPHGTLIASTQPHQVADADALRRAEILRRFEARRSVLMEDDFSANLAAAADQFIVARGDQKTVIAGYHWFSDWGRDTMIALPGLTLPTGRHEVARSILREFAGHVHQGMLPNRFPDEGETPEYNTVDATLWFFEAVRQYLDYTGDHAFVHSDLYEVLAGIIAWHLRGTRYGIKMDEDGLLASGEPGVQLTWMDAKVGDWLVTPRHGKAVEIQALWHNALCVMEGLAGRFCDEARGSSYRRLADNARLSFNRLFWNEQTGCLYDVVHGQSADGSIRPNQIIAVSLTHSMLSEERSSAVVDKVRELLLTPFGLRTLAPDDPRYRPRYEGGPRERDSAYHQGTVWPWLMGPFITAYVKVNGGSDTARRQAGEWLRSLKDHLSDAGIGQISEIFDGSAPHRPCGCIAQAWSVGEILRAYIEDVHGVRPGHGRASRRSLIEPSN